MRHSWIFTFFFFITLLALSAQQEATSEIWYAEPAEVWDHALPVGNGRMGAMVFGRPQRERIQLNEDSLWPGGPEWGNTKGTPEDLAHLRQLILDGQVHLADSLIVEYFSYKGVGRSHQTMGDLYIDFHTQEITDYRRALKLNEAFVETRFTADGYGVSQTVFASHPDEVLVVHLETENPQGLNLSLELNRPEDEGNPTVKVTATPEQLRMQGMVTQFSGGRYSQSEPIDHGVQFETILVPILPRGGTAEVEGEILHLEGAPKVTLLLVMATSSYHKDYLKANQAQLAQLKGLTNGELFARHLNDYQQLYKRVELELNGPCLDGLSARERLARVKEGKPDVDLEERLFNFGRYLLISCSRPGTNPANLQGLWNEHISAPWNADYHLNINLQMNYWPAEVTNLSECHLPLFDLGDRLLERGKILAREQYGMQGAIVHHTTDFWGTPWMRAATPYWGSWIHGGGWLVRHYWEHFAYSQDTTFLRERAYPALQEYARFYLDWLIENPAGEGLISVPETSPENSYIAADGKSAAVSAGAAMGYQIIHDVFGNTLRAGQILGESDDLLKEIASAQKRLPSGLEIGPDGRLLEWPEFYEEPEKGHRHISHLYALHPDDAVIAENADIFAAAKETIQYRLKNGGAGPGWSRAWIINFYARLLEGDTAHFHIKRFLQNSIYPNLMDIHPPFQIDGNFGYTAGIAEMLLQSHEGFLRILPALPKAWPTGFVKGLKARGNIMVDIYWEDGALSQLVLIPAHTQQLDLLYGAQRVSVTLEKGKPTVLGPTLK